MNFFTLFIWHFFSDFFFQTKSMGEKKIFSEKFFNKYLIFHSVVYTLLFIPVFLICNINLLWLLLLLSSHILLDNKRILYWIHVNIKKEKEPLPWILIFEDQILHIIVLYMIYNFSI